MSTLEGKRIVVTGATRGLGRGFALGLAAAGARLVVNGTNAALAEQVTEEIRAAGGTAEPVVGSVTDDSLAERLITTCVERYGGVDSVVNNAGIVRDRTLMNMTPDEFDEVIAVNLRGTWSVSRHAARAMKATGGHLLQIFSNSGFTGSIGQTNYAASKFAVIGMMKTWARELGRKGIRCNAICPGFIATSILTTIPEKVLQALEEKVPMGRLGRPEEVANTFAWLASDEASYINGAVIEVSGGLTI